MRQSEGKRTENKLSAADLNVLCARLRSPLLKTTLLGTPTRKYLWPKYSRVKRMNQSTLNPKSLKHRGN